MKQRYHRHRRTLRPKMVASLLAGLTVSSLSGAVLAQGDANKSKVSTPITSVDGIKLDLVVPNEDDQPRRTPLNRDAMKQYLEDLKARTPRIPLPELTEEEKKRALEDNRAFGYEGRLRSSYLGEGGATSYGGFWGSAARPAGNAGAAPRPGATNTPPESKLSLDYAFKVRLFWIAARANNCQYCLGHQESKLLAAGMTEDAIAALDTDWESFPENERVAFALAKKMTNDPHLLGPKDIEACKPFYNDSQLIEMVCSIAGYNAINRWKEGTGTPQSGNGGNFGRPAPGEARSESADKHSYLTPTSKTFAERVTKVAVVDPADLSLKQSAPTQFKRPPLESMDVVKSKLKAVSQRSSMVALADEATAKEVFGDALQGKPVESWHRMLAQFPVAGKRFADGMIATQKHDALSPALQAKIDWVVARQDRAWYAISLASDALKSNGVGEAEIASLDGDIKRSGGTLDPKERALLLVAKNLAASPIILTDREVAQAVEIAGPRAVTQVINYTTYRAAFDRLTEAVQLPR